MAKIRTRTRQLLYQDWTIDVRRCIVKYEMRWDVTHKFSGRGGPTNIRSRPFLRGRPVVHLASFVQR